MEGAPDRSLTIKEVAKTAYLQVDKLPQEIEPGLEARRRRHHFTWPFGTSRWWRSTARRGTWS